jgi:hypothetical protein
MMARLSLLIVFMLGCGVSPHVDETSTDAALEQDVAKVDAFTDAALADAAPANDSGATPRCSSTLAEMFGFLTSAPDVLFASNSEFSLGQGGYEQIRVYEDGMRVYER